MDFFEGARKTRGVGVLRFVGGLLGEPSLAEKQKRVLLAQALQPLAGGHFGPCKKEPPELTRLNRTGPSERGDLVICGASHALPVRNPVQAAPHKQALSR